MTNFQKVAMSFLTVLAIGIIGMIIWVYQTKWKVPLGPALQIPSLTPYKMPPTWTPNPDAMRALVSTPWPVSATQTVPATATNSFGSCGLPSVMTILAIGSDTRSDKYLYGLADAIRIVRIDSVTPKITVLEIPRDL